MDKVKDHFKNDRFAATNGIKLIEVRPGHALAKMEVQERHLNGIGTVQGGALFTLADLAFAAACNAAGKVAVGLNTNMSYLKAVSSGTLTAEAVEVARSRKISTCSVRVTNEHDDLVAVFQGTAYIKSTEFPPS
jgi:acyl-CoA thioesterase